MEENMFFRPILKTAWQITKKFKSLWFLGLFAAILSVSGEFELLAKIIFGTNKTDSTFGLMIKEFKDGMGAGLEKSYNFWNGAWESLTNSPMEMISLILILIATIIITLFVIWLAVVSQIGLIKNISLINKKKKPTINEGIDTGVENFWPILLINIIYKILLMLIFLLLSKEVLLLIIWGVTGTIIHIISLTSISIITILISFVVRYQILSIILNKEKAIPALKAACRLFKDNWLISIEMAFILFIVYIIAAYLTVFLTAILLAIPIVFITFANQIPSAVIMTIGLMSFIAIFIQTFIITALFSTYQWSSWTLLFSEINNKKAISKIVRLSEKSPNIPILTRKK